MPRYLQQTLDFDDERFSLYEEGINDVITALSFVPLKERQTLLLTAKGHSNKEIAEAIQVSVRSVTNIRIRAKKLLIERLLDLYAF